MYFANPKEGERFYLRVLLCHVRGAKSFSDLRTYQNVTYPTFQEAAFARGLLESDDEWDKCLKESADVASAKMLRELFTTILIFGQPRNVSALYEKYFINLSEDFTHQGLTEDEVFNSTAKSIDDLLFTYGKKWENIAGLPIWNRELQQGNNQPRIITDALEQDPFMLQEDLNNIDLLNDAQKAVFDSVKDAVENPNEQLNHHFFLDGPGGSGKTFTYSAILAYHRSQGKICLGVASSGIAACLLPQGLDHYHLLSSIFFNNLSIRKHGSFYIWNSSSIKK